MGMADGSSTGNARPVILGYFGASRLSQLTAGSIYAWALVLMLIGLITAELKQRTAPAQEAFLR
ncbi:hypothetical protein B5E41_21175 [Rhizobium esperanzae]|uniref:Uncharacterized protein n=1 Tax=Rhizobium esperanzae TaxID=1967781 RepID=A0A246DQS9_9HYPH|nr:hypothetical protein [Rhizobium esperanzae]OWO92603.1 hypothetical protein B5E41_21175 [Rhizobium esperanzae]